MRKAIVFLKFFLLSEWVFTKPKPKKFLLVDGVSNPFLKIYKKSDFNILFRRGESLNLYILFKCLMNFRISTLDYFKFYIEASKPKLILTAYDYNPIFYKLSKLTGIKTIMLQKAKRIKTHGIIKNEKKIFGSRSKKNNFVDFIFLFNHYVAKFYKKRISGKYFINGSFDNNFSKINFKNQKKEILFISTFKADPNDKNKVDSLCENDDIIISYLGKLAYKNKIKFNILTKRLGADLEREIQYYKKILNNDFKLILKNRYPDSYKQLAKYRYVFTSYSTLGIENLAKGGRSGFILFRPASSAAYQERFGSFEGLPMNGPFWSTMKTLDVKEIERVFNFVIKTNRSSWSKLRSRYISAVMNYDYKNSKLKKVIEKELSAK